MRLKSKKNIDGVKATECLYGSINSIENDMDYLSDYCPQCQRIESPKSLDPVEHGYRAIFECNSCGETWDCYYAKDYVEMEGL